MNSSSEVERIREACGRTANKRVERTYAAPARAPERLTTDENERIVVLYDEGTKVAEIARLVGISEWTVHHRLNRMGVERRPRGLSLSQIDEAACQYEQGNSVREIQAKIGFSVNTIRNALRVAGVYTGNQRSKG